MADNVAITAGAGTTISTEEVTTLNGGAVSAQHIQRVANALRTADGTAIDLPGDSTNGLDVDVTRVPSDPFGANGDAASSSGSISAKLRFIASTGIPVTGTVTVGSHAVTNAGTFAVQAEGDVAHDTANSGKPMQSGSEAIAHGTNPTAVAAGRRTKNYANRAGIPFVIAGHPNVLTLEYATTGSQTDAAIITISTGSKIVVTQAQLIADNANTAFPQVRVGFGTANTPTTTGVVLSHPGVPAGGGISRGDGSGIIGIGADNEDLRITCGAPTGGSLRVIVSYYTIES